MLARIEGDPARLDWLDARIATYKKLKKKYGPDIADVLATLEKTKARLNDLENRGEKIAAVEKETNPISWRAFWLTAIEGKSAQQVADQLSMRLGSVYSAKSRVLARIRQMVGESNLESDHREETRS